MTAASDDYRRQVAAEERFVRGEEGRYRLDVREFGITLDLDRLRRESGALVGELVVRSSLPGVRAAFGGVLSAGDFNLSSVRARQDRAKYLSSRARVEEIDFNELLEELCLRVIAAEREGSPMVVLRDLPRPVPDEARVVDGLPLLARHPMILFGDGGAAKSFLALYLAGTLEQRGIRCGVYDWELSGPDHRDRLERIFGADMPEVRYRRCGAPLIDMADSIRRDVRDKALEYLVFDSVAFACHDAPENAVTAGAYFQALRSIGTVGSLNLAHITKAEGGDRKPFGSSFWHNGARSSWFLRRAEDGDGDEVAIAAYNRKHNLGPLLPAIGWRIDFAAGRATFHPAAPADSPELAAGLSVRQRMTAVLRRGSQEPEAVAQEIGADAETVKRTARRYKAQFTVLPGGQLGLCGRGGR